MLKRIALLTNPSAGKGKALGVADIALRRFQELGVEVISDTGTSKQASAELIEGALASSVDALVVCGGDGMVNLALQKQAFHDMPLGIIPAGTGNDHARNYGIPLNPAEAAEVVARGKTKTTDLGRLISGSDPDTSMIFGTIACQGFDSLTNTRTNRMRWPTGNSRYVLAALLEFATFQKIPSRIFVEGEEAPRELDLTLIAVGNTSSYGGGAAICPKADPTDGLLDVTMIQCMSKFAAVCKLNAFFQGRNHDQATEVITLRTKKIRIEMDRPVPSCADGEFFGNTPVEVEVLPGAGHYLVP